MTDSFFEPGMILAGKFRVEQVLGRGGMGVVVQAHHIELDEPVAIKFLLHHALSSEEAVARFEREARAAVRIKSEHVARVSDVGRLEGGLPYMVMELLRGADLAEILQKNGPLPLADAADYILQACEAVAEAHTLGIVHRDVKPANLFLIRRPDGAASVKVLDFGISKSTGLPGSTPNHAMTRTSAVMGSPLYMSPEQLASARDVDMRADIWALGVVLFELITGRHPFVGETLPQLCAAIITQAPIALCALRPDMPEGVDRLIAACLEKDRATRVQTVADFATRLIEFAPRRSRLSAERIVGLSQGAGFSIASSELPPASVAAAHAHSASPPHGQTVAQFGRTSSGTSSRKWRTGGVLGLLVSIGMGSYLLVHARAISSPPLTAGSVSPASAAAPSPLSIAEPTATLVVESSPVSPGVVPMGGAPEPQTAPSAMLEKHEADSKPVHHAQPAVPQKPQTMPASSAAAVVTVVPPKLETKPPAPAGTSLGGRL